MIDHSLYLVRFEKEVMIPIFEASDKVVKINIPVRPSRLLKTNFGKTVGGQFEYDRILALNYYGLMKVSTGFIEKMKEMKKEGYTIQSAITPVVYFASVRSSHISKYSPDLSVDFPEFKSKLVDLRWGDKKVVRKEP